MKQSWQEKDFLLLGNNVNHQLFGTFKSDLITKFLLTDFPLNKAVLGQNEFFIVPHIL